MTWRSDYKEYKSTGAKTEYITIQPRFKMGQAGLRMSRLAKPGA